MLIPKSLTIHLPAASISELDQRAREVFRLVVESYLETGELIGSRTLSKSGISLSPASIRNTLQDLSLMGLLSAPHISSGRMPTHHGLRLFIDGLLEIGDVAEEEKKQIEAHLLGRQLSFDEALHEASNLLSGLAGGAGLVVTPISESPIKHLEMIALSHHQVLIVLVHEDGHIENRLMSPQSPVSNTSLAAAAQFLSERFVNKTLSQARAELKTELEDDRLKLDEAASHLIEAGLALWSAGPDHDNRALIVRGRAKLLENSSSEEDLERVRKLMDDLEEKQSLISLLDDVRQAQGVRIYIGAESKLFSLSGSAVIAAPYVGGDAKGPRMMGAIGVIGPTRLNYARIIPLVDYTARLLSKLID